MKIQLQVIHQQRKLINDMKSIHPIVSKELWGHHSRTWPRSRKRKPLLKSSQKSTKLTQQTSSKPFSIPFSPKPLYLLNSFIYPRIPLPMLIQPPVPYCHSSEALWNVTKLPMVSGSENCLLMPWRGPWTLSRLIILTMMAMNELSLMSMRLNGHPSILWWC